VGFEVGSGWETSVKSEYSFRFGALATGGELGAVASTSGGELLQPVTIATVPTIAVNPILSGKNFMS
jgi:hypothetical protein